MKGFGCVALLFYFSIPFAEAQDLASARGFVSKLYDSYEHPACPECPVFDKEAPHIFSPSLLRLIHRDKARRPKGYVGALDFDPICACQDAEGLHVLKMDITSLTPDRAAANVLVGYTGNLVGYTGNATQTIRLSLLHTPPGWRVDDVSAKDEASLRKLLNGANR